MKIAVMIIAELTVQWNLTYPDTSVSKQTVRITEYPDKWGTFSIYNFDWFQNLHPDKWIIWISRVRISEASLYTVYIVHQWQIIRNRNFNKFTSFMNMYPQIYVAFIAIFIENVFFRKKINLITTVTISISLTKLPLVVIVF